MILSEKIDYAEGLTFFWSIGFDVSFPVSGGHSTDPELERWANGKAQRAFVKGHPTKRIIHYSYEQDF